jgi:uncharacterized protein YecE (DUF72 family)
MMYYSPYSEDQLAQIAGELTQLAAERKPVCCILENAPAAARSSHEQVILLGFMRHM